MIANDSHNKATAGHAAHADRNAGLVRWIVDSTKEWIWSVDAHANGLISFNKSLADYFLHERQKILKEGMTPEELLPNDELAQKWKGFYRRTLDEGAFSTEYAVASGNHALHISFHPLLCDGIAIGISVFARDITEQKKSVTDFPAN